MEHSRSRQGCARFAVLRYNQAMFEYALMGAAALLIVWALLRLFKPRAKRKTERTERKEAARTLFVNCPLCSSPLRKGENLFSKVFRPMTVSDQRCVIFGCPRCYPVAQAGISRVCPSCRAAVPQDGHLVARLFNKTKSGKKHVVITGCTVCCKNEMS